MPEYVVDYRDIPMEPDRSEKTARRADEFMDAEEMSFSFLTFEPGQGGDLHYHEPPLEELYIVVDGHLDITVEGETTDAGPGTAVYIPPETVHQPVNNSDEPATIFVTSIPPDQWNKTVVEPFYD